MKVVCVLCGKRFYDMELIAIAEGWRHCCRQLYPPLYPPHVPAEAPYQERRIEREARLLRD